MDRRTTEIELQSLPHVPPGGHWRRQMRTREPWRWTRRHPRPNAPPLQEPLDAHVWLDCVYADKRLELTVFEERSNELFQVLAWLVPENGQPANRGGSPRTDRWRDRVRRQRRSSGMRIAPRVVEQANVASPGACARPLKTRSCSSGRVVRFEWDAEKAAQNLAKHGVSFAEASTAFNDPLFNYDLLSSAFVERRTPGAVRHEPSRAPASRFPHGSRRDDASHQC